MTPAAHNTRITGLAATRAVHQAFAWLHLHEPQLRRWQLEFLAVPAPTFAESERAAWFRDKFTQLGLAHSHIDAAGNALAELRAADAADDGPCVLLSAHLDTVFAAGTDCTPREEGAVILGPGATDNGAGLAALLAVAAALRHAELLPGVTVLFAANVGEEGEGDLRGIRHIFSAESPYHGRIHAAIALEGSGTATVVDRALGSRRLRVSISGPGGHSWADAGRPNPIAALAASVLELERLALPTNPRTTLNIGVISGGTSINSIPELASADLDIRSTSAMELDRTELAILRTLEDAVSRRNSNVIAEWQMKLQALRIGDRAAGALSPKSSLFQSLQAVDRHLNIATDPHIGSTDANLPLSLGTPALAIGCGGVGSGIHTLAESYDPTGRDLALRRILLLLLDACSPA
jgi:acetylornithine deacetylase/succinyl-diaminopimelate desuccinylase-like protein